MEHPIPIAAVIVHDKRTDKILLGRRCDDLEYGLYGLPGGKQNKGERIIACAIRELKEETGLVANKIRCLGYIDEMMYGHHFGCHIFLCQDYTGEEKNMEPTKCQGWEWILRTLISGMDNRTELVALIHQADMLYGW